MEILIRDTRFWVALLLLIRSVLFYAVPAFPEQIWVAIDTFVGVVLGILAGNNVVQRRAATRLRLDRSVSSRRGRGTVGRGSSFGDVLGSPRRPQALRRGGRWETSSCVPCSVFF